LIAATFFAAAGCVGGCGGGGAKLKTPARGVYGELAVRSAEAPCADAAPLPVPTARAAGTFDTDVVFYLAHPEDETLYTPGTMEALGRAKRRAFVMYLSHGEGGRLLERAPDGQIKEKIDASPAQVAEVRDRELALVMKTLGLPYDRLYPASVNADFAAKQVEGLERAAHACAETYERWDSLLPGGLPGLLAKLVEDIRTRRPRVVVTHDPRDDEDFLDHGHHKALGALVDVAARAAADPRYPGGAPHVVEELVTIAPKQADADVTLPVGNTMRKKLMLVHASQFEAPKFADVGQRTTERFVVRWRSSSKGSPGAQAPRGGSLFATLAEAPAAAPLTP
jgi:LmbE family N-acetylglucosaminyl deacetylase